MNPKEEEKEDGKILNDYTIEYYEYNFDGAHLMDSFIQSFDRLSLAVKNGQKEEIFKSDELFKDFFRLCDMSILKRTNEEYVEFTQELKNNLRYTVIIDLYVYILENCQRNCEFARAKPVDPLDVFRIFTRTTPNEKRTHALCKLARSGNFLLASLIEFRVYAMQAGLAKQLIGVLGDHEFLKRLDVYHMNTCSLFVFSVNWLSKIAENYKILWYEYDSINVLLNVEKWFPTLRLYIYMAVANIAYDKDIENLDRIHEAVDKFVQLTVQCINDPIPKRHKQEFSIEDDQTSSTLQVDVMYILDVDNQATVSITGLLLSLYRISINNKIKWSMYQINGLKDALKRLINTNGNEVEKQYALELLAQLCFDDRVNNDLRSDQSFLASVRSIVDGESRLTYVKLAKTARQLMWLLSEKKIESTEQTGHIMISYNSASRELCLKIKKNLQDAGHRVWIDVQEIHGSSLDSMARAVEQASCVLICVTEKYRQSLNCQSEAQYAFKLSKKIVPLIMQKGYGNVDGWLGFVIGDKIFIDFTKYEYDECMKKLKNQISLLTGEKHASAVAVVQPMAMQSPTKVVQIESGKDCMNWDDMQVESWCRQVDCAVLYDRLKPINGKVLYQLYQLQLYNPQFFYKSLTNKNDDLDIKLLAVFSSHLRELFD